MRTLRLSSLLLSLSLLGCPSTPSTATDGGATSDTGGSTGDAGPSDAGGSACAPTTVPCIDESIGLLDLFDRVSAGAITEEGTAAGEFLTHIDSTAMTPPGSTMPMDSYVYARFTDAGLEKVEISDEDAFASTDWDIAFRRYVVRLNSGVSGPSCVTAMRTAPDTLFEDVTAVPSGLPPRVEEYLTETCEIVTSDGVGSPSTALSSFYTYDGCVSMNHNVYVVALANGRHVKLEVESYYSPENQELCDTTGSFMSPSGAGNMRVRWAFLD
jgi:hypothetical protein